MQARPGSSSSSSVSKRRGPPVRAVEDLRFLVEVRFGGKVIHSSCTEGSAEKFPMLVDVPIEPPGCVIRQPGVNLSSQEVVGSDW